MNHIFIERPNLEELMHEANHAADELGYTVVSLQCGVQTPTDGLTNVILMVGDIEHSHEESPVQGVQNSHDEPAAEQAPAEPAMQFDPGLIADIQMVAAAMKQEASQYITSALEDAIQRHWPVLQMAGMLPERVAPGEYVSEKPLVYDEGKPGDWKLALADQKDSVEVMLPERFTAPDGGREYFPPKKTKGD